MAEPVITPLAAFGLSMAILNFFISTIQTLHERYYEIKDYQQMLHDLKRDLFVCAGSYHLWFKLWGRTSEPSYEALFGNDWREIKKNQQRIEGLARKTADLLCLKTTLPPSHSQEPQAAPASATPDGHEPPASDRPSTTPALAPRGRKHTNRLRNALGWLSRLVRQKSKAKGTASDDSIELEADDRRDWESFVGSLSNAFLEQSVQDIIEQVSEGSEAARPSWDNLANHALRPTEELMRRILGIFGRNKYLKANVSDLEKAVRSLGELTKNAVEKKGHGPVPTQPHEVMAIEDAEKFREIAQTLKDVVQGQNPDVAGNSEWFLGLERPDHLSAKVAAMEIFKRCNLSFVVILVTSDVLAWKKKVEIARLKGREEDEARTSGTFRNDFASAVKDFQGSKIDIESSNAFFRLESMEAYPKFVTENWQVLLKKCSVETNVRKYLELARAGFALGLALWMILLWETDWFTHVCSCAFRCVLFPSSGRASNWERQDRDENEAETLTGPRETYRQENIYASIRRELSSAAAPPVRQDQEPANGTELANGANVPASCRGDTVLKDRLYHFGILLSELILAHPISLTSDLGQQRPAAVGRPTGLFEESREILQKISPRKVKNAIDFCFTEATDVWERRDRSHTTTRQNQFIENVVEPLIEYHDVVKKHFKPHYAEEFVRCVEEYRDEAYDQFEDAVENLP
jgi:hypothetical protein